MKKSIIDEDEVEWTVPKWTVIGDVVFFFHAKTAIQIIRRLTTALENNKDQYNYKLLSKNLLKARELYKQYGGKIFAVGQVLGKPFYDNALYNTELHWHGKIYARIGNIRVLKNAVSIEEFNSFIMLSRQSAITSVIGSEYEKLKRIIISKNDVPDYFKESVANPFPLNCITKENFWTVTSEYRRAFFLEKQFRVFYVDYLLALLGDQKKIYKECACYRDDELTGYADNSIFIQGKFLFVEVKLNIDSERNFVEQLQRYSSVERATIEKQKSVIREKIYQRCVLVIDIYQLGIYDNKQKIIKYLTSLESLKSKEDVLELKSKIISIIKM